MTEFQVLGQIERKNLTKCVFFLIKIQPFRQFNPNNLVPTFYAGRLGKTVKRKQQRNKKDIIAPSFLLLEIFGLDR